MPSELGDAPPRPTRVASDENREGIETQCTRLGAERLGGERSCQRGVDAAGDADDDLREAVLLDVVAEAELKREPHLLEVVELGEQTGARTGTAPSPLHDEQRILEARRAK